MTPGRAVAAASMLAIALPALAQAAAPYAKGNATEGQAIAERDCVSCHAAKFGNAEAIYLRRDRRVTTPAQLLAQVQRCNAELARGYFPDEEESVAAYLDRDFYRFAR